MAASWALATWDGLMSFIGLLRQTCIISRPTYGVDDPFGQPTETWAVHKSGVKCRLMPIKGKEIATIEKDMVISTHKLFMKHFAAVGDDPREYDVISGITEASGFVRDENAGSFDVVLVNHIGEYGQEHHLEIYLVRRKGPP